MLSRVRLRVRVGVGGWIPAWQSPRRQLVAATERAGARRGGYCTAPSTTSSLSSSAAAASPTSKEVRETFVRFFREKHGHAFVPSSNVKPRADPSLLFVNAGMNQFKPLLLGSVDPRSELARCTRAVNSQKCVRAGGKHNDLEDVGRDVYHHTFFEMLGNWSFGDYFKREVCQMAWELLTEVYRIPKERLYVSYFGGSQALGLKADEECREIWLQLGVAAPHVLPFGEKENLWEMGEVGPCGPCSEIHYDHVGGRDASGLVNAGHPDVVEIWNLVFMQYNREENGSLRLLPRHNVDCGMGFERLLAVLQGKRSNYDTDLFTPIMSAIHKGTGAREYRGLVGEADEGHVDTAYRVLADHVRTLAVCIADGVYPGMTGAELVLRQILRRATRFAIETLRAQPGLLASLVPTVVDILGDTYPELNREAQVVMDVINENEAAFLSSLSRGRRLMERTVAKMGTASASFPVDVAWSLHRGLGFPFDLIHLMLDERGLSLDTVAFNELERAELRRAQQQKQEGEKGEAPGRESLLLDVHALDELRSRGVPATDDAAKYAYELRPDGRYEFARCSARVVAVWRRPGLSDVVGAGERCSLVLDATCFYSEQGGQDGDTGVLLAVDAAGQQDIVAMVEDVQVCGGFVLHHVVTRDTVRVGDRLLLAINEERRLGCMIKHTATHLLSQALRDVLGNATQQRGSHVAADRLRFDFSTRTPVSVDQLRSVEAAVCRLVSADERVFVAEAPLASARRIPHLRCVDEDYPEEVRVVSVGTPAEQLLRQQQHTDGAGSVELCCGTHLQRTGLIEDFVIVSERAMVKGLSRVVAVTDREAREARRTGEALAQQADSLGERVAHGAASLPRLLGLSKEVGQLTDVVDRAVMPQWQRKELQQMLKTMQRKANTAVRKLRTSLAEKAAETLAEKHANETLIVDVMEAENLSVLVRTVNELSRAVPDARVLLMSIQPGGQLLCACQVPKEMVDAFPALDWAQAVCGPMGGKAIGSQFLAKVSATIGDHGNSTAAIVDAALRRARAES
ncbi:alanine--tRNA ligase, mitochondrial [Lethenteron reissneri]|uniref:alanine--tRNA ligase, mitochondrial n=1 Tax=Lethenteron reissneri TaxID=7753 RepID=UPI002AB5E2B7|nr:alanine--tRNA ligase, mitochondrial [Lethenteron reissneri]